MFNPLRSLLNKIKQRKEAKAKKIENFFKDVNAFTDKIINLNIVEQFYTGYAVEYIDKNTFKQAGVYIKENDDNQEYLFNADKVMYYDKQVRYYRLTKVNPEDLDLWVKVTAMDSELPFTWYFYDKFLIIKERFDSRDKPLFNYQINKLNKEKLEEIINKFKKINADFVKRIPPDPEYFKY